MKKVTIKPKGSYFKADENGFLINPADISKIQKKYKPVIKDIIDAYKNIYGKNLKNVYLRGSVAKGEAIENISDIDSFAYVDLSDQELKSYRQESDDLQKKIEEKYDFLNDIEMGGLPLSDITEDYVILNQSVCLFGDPILVPKLKVGKDLIIRLPLIKKNIIWFLKFLDKDESEQEIKKGCVWIMKGFLRAGFELTIERSKKYTRDLYLCYKNFAEYYPEKEPEMLEILDLALNPTSDKGKIKKVIDGFGAWLVKEIPNHFDIKEDN